MKSVCNYGEHFIKLCKYAIFPESILREICFLHIHKNGMNLIINNRIISSVNKQAVEKLLLDKVIIIHFEKF